MNYLDEKKLVAEWMGWYIDKGQTTGLIQDYCNIVTPLKKIFPISDWDPKTDRNAWPEIWDKMDAELFHRYIKKYDLIPQSPIEYTWRVHTAKSEICWQALVETLKEGEG